MRKIEEFWIEFTPDEPQKANAAVSFIFDVTDSLKGAVIAAFVIFCLVFRVIGVEGTSMMPTLHDGDWVAVSGISMNIKKGDKVFFIKEGKAARVRVPSLGSGSADQKG